MVEGGEGIVDLAGLDDVSHQAGGVVEGQVFAGQHPRRRAHAACALVDEAVYQHQLDGGVGQGGQGCAQGRGLGGAELVGERALKLGGGVSPGLHLAAGQTGAPHLFEGVLAAVEPVFGRAGAQ